MLFRKLAVFLIVLGGSAGFASSQLPCSSVAEYRTLLERISRETQAAKPDIEELIIQVPNECEFEAGGRHFQISTAQIQSELFDIKSADEDSRAAKLEALRKSVLARERALDGYNTPVDPTATPKLKEIFTRGEFKNVGTQSTEALLQEELLKLLIRVFSLIFKNPEDATLFAKVFVWTVMGLLAAFILWKLYRWATRAEGAYQAREVIPFAPSAKSWEQWMNEAKAALAAGEYRDAVHLSYWAAISHLERSGAWTPDKARTPREYLRLMAASNPARPLLADVSRVFEVVWYGQRVPTESECRQFLERVENIACR